MNGRYTETLGGWSIVLPFKQRITPELIGQKSLIRVLAYKHYIFATSYNKCFVLRHPTGVACSSFRICFTYSMSAISIGGNLHTLPQKAHIVTFIFVSIVFTTTSMNTFFVNAGCLACLPFSKYGCGYYMGNCNSKLFSKFCFKIRGASITQLWPLHEHVR